MLSQHKDDEYRIIAGGQSLNTAMKHRLIAPAYIIDIKNISGSTTSHSTRKRA